VDCQLQHYDTNTLRWKDCVQKVELNKCYLLRNTTGKPCTHNLDEFKVRAQCKQGKTLCPMMFSHHTPIKYVPSGMIPHSAYMLTYDDLLEYLESEPCRPIELSMNIKMNYRDFKKDDYIVLCEGKANMTGTKCKAMKSQLLAKVAYNIDNYHKKYYEVVSMAGSVCQSTSKPNVGKEGKSSKATASKGKAKGGSKLNKVKRVRKKGKKG